MLLDWINIETWGTRGAAIAAGLGAIYGGYKALKAGIVKISAMASKIQNINEQLSANGGSSLLDAIRRMEHRQIKAEQREQAFLRNYPSQMFELDGNLQLIWANRAFLDALEVDTDLVTEHGWHNAISEEDRIRIVSQLQSALLTARDTTTKCVILKNMQPDRQVPATIAATVMRNTTTGKGTGFLVIVNFHD